MRLSTRSTWRRWAAFGFAACIATPLILAAASCYKMRPSRGGGEISFDGARAYRAEDIAVPSGYRIEIVATGLTFPTGVAFDAQGKACVVESGYCYGEVWTTPQLLRIEADGKATPIARGGDNGPWNGVTYSDGAFFVAEGGAKHGGRILRIGADGEIKRLAENLPSLGDHHTNGPIAGPDGLIYFGQGTATNSGVVGEDNASFGWLKRNPTFHDIPGGDVTLSGQNFTTRNPLEGGKARKTVTGPFLPFGTPGAAGQIIKGSVPCTGAIMTVPANGGALRLVAWGFRNPFGLAFAPDGALYATDNGYDDRGSRPVWGAGELLWRVEKDKWHGWPDFSGRTRIDDAGFHPPGGAEVKPALAAYPNEPPEPAAILDCHSSSDGLDFSRSAEFGHVGEAFIAMFGDQAPAVGKTLQPAGFKVVRVDLKSGAIEDFAINKGSTNGPASKIGGGGLERPIAARFNPAGDALYVVDFGILLMDKKGAYPREGTGSLWKIAREGVK